MAAALWENAGIVAKFGSFRRPCCRAGPNGRRSDATRSPRTAAGRRRTTTPNDPGEQRARSNRRWRPGFVKYASGLSGESLARPRHVDHCVDDEVGNVNTVGSQPAGHRLGEDPLRCFGWRERGEERFAASCRGVAGNHDGAFAAADHVRGNQLRELQQAGDVDREVAFEVGEVDLQARRRASRGPRCG